MFSTVMRPLASTVVSAPIGLNSEDKNGENYGLPIAYAS